MTKMPPGYAFTSTRRRPVRPDTVVVGSECERARYVGTANIDGYQHHAFRLGRRYYFVLFCLVH